MLNLHVMLLKVLTLCHLVLVLSPPISVASAGVYTQYNTYDVGENHVGPYAPTRAERRYAKRRRRQETRWGLDVDVRNYWLFKTDQTAVPQTIQFWKVRNYWLFKTDQTAVSQTIQFWKGFMERHGYLNSIPDYLRGARHIVHTRYERKEAIRMFQEFFNLKQTGKLNKKTVKIMKEPRCGLPDVGLDEPRSRVRDFHVYQYYPRWRRSVLTWKASKYTKKISPLGLWKTIKKAFEIWSAVSGIRFIYTRQTPDIEIRFEAGNHKDGRSIAFDGEGGQVAHSFGPGEYTISGDVHLDAEEPWTLSVDPKDGMNILGVLVHEIGHALGLRHSDDPRSVMHPAFVATRLDLSVDDIQNIQILYGPNPKMASEPYIQERAAASATTTVPPKICKLPMDDIELGPDGYAYIFRNEHVRQIDKRGTLVKTKEKLKISDVYEGAPKKVDAVAYLIERKTTYMFYNKSVWRYTNFDLDRGYPKVITGRQMPEVPKAAAFIRDQYGITRLLLFGADKFWEWSTARDQMSKGYPLKTRQYFEEMPRSPSGALRWKDGYIYFFKRDKVYKVHPGTYKVLQGWPQLLPPDWIKGAC